MFLARAARWWLLFFCLVGASLPQTAFGQYQQVGDPLYGRISCTIWSLETPYQGAGTPPANLRTLEIASGWLADNERVQVYDAYTQNGSVTGKVQEWIFIPAGRIEGEMSYFIINRWYRRYMESAGLNGQVRARAYNGQLNQRWFIDAGFTPSQKFLRSASNGLYLTFPNSANGSAVVMQTLNLGPAQQVRLIERSISFPIKPYNWNYSQPTLIRLADNQSLVFGDSGQSMANVQNQVIVLQNRVAGANYQVWEPHSENQPSYTSWLPADDGFRLFKRWTGFTVAPWNNFGAINYGITTRAYEANPGESQRWYCIPSSEDGQFSLVHAASGLTLQPTYNGQGALLVLVPIGTASSQRLVFTSP